MKHLLYRRQFIMSYSKINELSYWQNQNIFEINLYVHPDLEITRKEKKPIILLMLGYIFDPFNPSWNNDEILSDIILKVDNFDDLFMYLKAYPGRYVIIYRDNEKFNIFNDAFGTREIYYCSDYNKIICGSQPNLIAKFSEPMLGTTHDPEIQNFYQNDMKYVRKGRFWVGDETYFESIKKLIPSHFLDINTLTVKRYWPNKKLEKISLHNAVNSVCTYLKGTIKAVTFRQEVMMAVTAGFDSRSLLAASRDITDKIYYFINKHAHLNENSPDISIPKKIFNNLNIPFHIHTYTEEVDEEFKSIFLNNTFFSAEFYLPVIYNIYFKEHQKKIILLGFGEIGREYYGGAPTELDGYYLARCLRYKKSNYATVQCDKWLKEAGPISKEYRIDILKLFLIESLIANWGTVGRSEADIAIEEFNPYASQYICEIMLSADQSRGDLFIEMFKKMWPELLNFPFNPNIKISDIIKSWLSKMGFSDRLRWTLYRVDRWKYKKLIEKKNAS